MEELIKEFNGKMQSLKFSLGKNEEVIGSKNTEAIARHGALLMSKLQAVHTVQESIVERKFTEGKSEEEVTTWTKEFDGFLKEADERALAIRQLVEKMEEEKRLVDKMESDKKEIALAKARHEERMSQERELLDKQMKFQKAGGQSAGSKCEENRVCKTSEAYYHKIRRIVRELVAVHQQVRR